MTLLGKITVELSDDPRYVTGETYDVVLSTSQAPDPATHLTGQINDPAPADAPADPAPADPPAG